MIRRKHLKEEEYKAIKSLLDNKVKIAVVSMVMKRSIATISWIKKSTSFEDYRAIVSSYSKYTKKPIVPAVAEPQAQPEQSQLLPEGTDKKLDMILELLIKLTSGTK